MKKPGYTKLFITSLLLTLVSGFVMGFRFSLTSLMNGRGWNIPEYVKLILGYSGYAFTAIAVYVGSQVGRYQDVENRYNSYIGVLIAGSFFGFVTLLLPQFTPINQDITMMMNRGSLTGMSVIMQYPAQLFSGICIGWFLRDRTITRPSIEKRLVRLLGLYQGWFTVTALIRTLLYMGMVREMTPRTDMGYFMAVTSLATNLVGYVYLNYLYQAGKDLDMEVVLEDVLFTLFVFSVGGRAVRNVIDILGGSRTIVSAATSMVRYSIGYGFSVFGTGFALTCYGYLRKNYMFPAFAKKKESG